MNETMNEKEYQLEIEAVLSAVENSVDAAIAPLDIDIDAARTGNVLSLSFDDGSKIIMNSQIANLEIWVAAKSGGFHYKKIGAHWVDTKTGAELFSVLTELASSAAGLPIQVRRDA
jgi:CyaY protein